MVRKVGFGDDETESDSGPVRRGPPPKNEPAKPGMAAAPTGDSSPEPEPETAEAPEAPELPAGPEQPTAPETAAPDAAPAPVAGKPRWGAIFMLMIVLSTWLAMSGLVIIGIVQRKQDGIPTAHLLWVALSVYGTIVLMRKLRHMYRGGSWLQTPADAARKSGGDTA